MTVPDPYAWRCKQPDEPSIPLADGRMLDPLNLGAVLPKRPVNPLARLIASQTPTRQLVKEDGTVLEVADEPLAPARERYRLMYIARRLRLWARRELHALGYFSTQERE